ncbi:MAG: hypothetical protein ACM3PE_04555 [Deltaproteobacteria bacterium]
MGIDKTAKSIDELKRPDHSDIPRTLWVGDQDKATTVTIRQIIPSDARQVYKMVKQSFGDVFGYYPPEEVIRLNQRGSLVSLVAVTEDGELAGHVDLEFFKGSNIAIMDNACSSEKYHHTQIVFELSKSIIDYARDSDVNGVITLSLTNHMITQRMANYFGNDCGILLGSVPIKDPACQEAQTRYADSATLNFIPLKTRTAANLYIPEHHRSLIEKIYSILGYSIICCDVDQVSMPATNGIIEVMPDNMGIVYFIVVDYGKDTLDQIESELEYLVEEGKPSTAYIYLNLEDPRTPHYVRLFEKIGFFFAGILPYGCKGCDAIILQYLNSTVDFNKIRIYSPIAQEIMAHIKSFNLFIR